jgi:hypothetical protein
MGVEDLASRGIEERFLDFADRLLRKSEGGRKSRPAPLGMTVLSGVGRLSGVERLGGVESLGGVGKMRRGLKRGLSRVNIFAEAFFSSAGVSDSLREGE